MALITKKDIKDKFKDIQKNIDEKYNSGVESTKRNRITAEAAYLADDLYKRDADELHENKDDLFRKVRKIFINGVVFITPFFIGLPIKMVDEAIQRKVDLNNAEKYQKIYDRELIWVNKAIREEKAKGHDVKELQKYKNNLIRGNSRMANYIEELKSKEKKYGGKFVKESFSPVEEDMGCCTPFGVFLALPAYDKSSKETEKEYDEKVLESFCCCLEDARDAVRAGVHAVRKGADAVHHHATNIDKTVEPADNFINDTIDKVKDSIRSDKRDEIILGENRVKLIRALGKAICYGGLVLVNPALAVIAFLTKLAYDKHIDSKERQRILNDLEHELVIVKEKIKDADSKGDNENKYKLMRIENKLERDIARIRYRIDEKV